MEYALIIILFILAFLIRIAFQLVPGSDAAVHYWRLSKVSKKKGKIDHSINDSVIGNQQAYPKLNHFIVSRFDAKYWPIIGSLINSSLDCFIGIILFILIKINYPLLYISSFYTIILIISLYLFSPVLLPIDARMKGINGRVLGGFFSTLYLISVFGVYDYSIWLFIPVIIFGNLAISSSQFSIQVIFSFSIILSLLLLNIIPLLSLIFTLLFSFSISSLGNIKVLNFWLIHKRWYYKSIKSIEIVASKNRFIDLLQLPKLLFTNPKRFFFLIFFQQSLALLILNGFVFIFLCYILCYSNIEKFNNLTNFSLYIVLASLIMFILTYKGPLAIIGEPERYLEYSLFFLCLVFIDVSRNSYILNNNVLFIIVLFQICILFLNIIVSLDPRKLFSNKVAFPSYTDDVMSFLSTEKYESKKSIAVIPIKSAMPLSYGLSIRGLCNIKFFYRHIEDGSSDFHYMHQCLGGRVKDPLGLRWGSQKNITSSEVFRISGADLYNLFKITHILIDATYRSRVDDQWLQNMLLHYELVLSTHDVDLYRYSLSK